MIPHQQTLRLFVAMELSPGGKLRLRRMQKELAPQCPDVRWTGDEQLHLTVRFIGDAPVGHVEAIARELTACAAAAEPFDMMLDGVGCFPAEGRVRVVWAGVKEDGGVLIPLAEAIDAGLTRLGYPSDGKPFRPHVTLGRVKEDRSRGELRSAIEAAKLSPSMECVDELVLIASDLSSRGPRYSVISTHALGGE